MTTRTFTVIQPDGSAERLTFLPSGVHREPTKTPRATRRAPKQAAEFTPRPFNASDPGWATPPWPTSRVTLPTPIVSTRKGMVVVYTGAGELSFMYDQCIQFMSHLIREAAPLGGASGVQS